MLKRFSRPVSFCESSGWGNDHFGTAQPTGYYRLNRIDLHKLHNGFSFYFLRIQATTYCQY